MNLFLKELHRFYSEVSEAIVDINVDEILTIIVNGVPKGFHKIRRKISQKKYGKNFYRHFQINRKSKKCRRNQNSKRILVL